jgi:hypothetical protein
MSIDDLENSSRLGSDRFTRRGFGYEVAGLLFAVLVPTATLIATAKPVPTPSRELTSALSTAREQVRQQREMGIEKLLFAAKQQRRTERMERKQTRSARRQMSVDRRLTRARQRETRP